MGIKLVQRRFERDLKLSDVVSSSSAASERNSGSVEESLNRFCSSVTDYGSEYGYVEAFRRLKQTLLAEFQSFSAFAAGDNSPTFFAIWVSYWSASCFES